MVISEPDYNEDLANLRKVYVEGTPRKRYEIAVRCIANPEQARNLLVVCVSAVEGLARSLIMRRYAKKKDDLWLLYLDHQWKGPEELIEEYLVTRALRPAPETFGADTWEHFRCAVEYRHLLTHECIYLVNNRPQVLIEACKSVLHKLARIAGLKIRRHLAPARQHVRFLR